jgi:hypothetical protein
MSIRGLIRGKSGTLKIEFDFDSVIVILCLKIERCEETSFENHP